MELKFLDIVLWSKYDRFNFLLYIEKDKEDRSRFVHIGEHSKNYFKYVYNLPGAQSETFTNNGSLDLNVGSGRIVPPNSRKTFLRIYNTSLINSTQDIKITPEVLKEYSPDIYRDYLETLKLIGN
jgi:hypothetical protein